MPLNRGAMETSKQIEYYGGARHTFEQRSYGDK